MAFPPLAPFLPAARVGRAALALGAALLAHGLGAAVQAAPPPAYPPDVFPPASVFRSLQLPTYACGRENGAERCAESRRVADALMDHPRLPARCKDVLWSIRNLSVVAPSNSMARRDPIDQAASEVTIACRQMVKVKPEEKPQGAGGEGFLRPAAPAGGQP